MSETIHPAIFAGYGLIEGPLDVVLDRFGSLRRADQSEMRIHGGSADRAETLAWLSWRTVPATRLALLDLGGWTGVLSNHRNGSDFNDHQYWARLAVGTATIRVVDSEARWWRRGSDKVRLAWEARIVELQAADGSTRRTITCANDGGRWD